MGFERFALSSHPICPRRPVGLECTLVPGVSPVSLAFQPPRLLCGRAASYGSFIVLSRGMIFSFQGTAPSLGLCPVWECPGCECMIPQNFSRRNSLAGSLWFPLREPCYSSFFMRSKISIAAFSSEAALLVLCVFPKRR